MTKKGEMKPWLERGQQVFEHKGDVSIIDNLIAEADEMIQRERGGLTMNDEEQEHLVKADSDISGPGTPPLAKREQLKLFAKIINHQYAAWSALFELITGYKPPKMKDIISMYGSH